MCSEQARQMVDAMWKERKKSQGQMEPVDYARRRAMAEARYAQRKLADGISVQAQMTGGVETECLVPEDCYSGDFIIYIHGGGFLTGSTRTSREYASFLARESGVRVYAVSYRLAPDYPWPAAPQDCMVVYRELQSAYPDARIALVGGSAGGNLCLTTMLRAKQEGVRLPCAAALYSPVTEQTGNLPSRRINAQRDCMLSPKSSEESDAAYLVNADVTDPDVSPLYGDLTGLPPLFITVDADELLKDDGILLDAYAREAGVETELRVSKGLFHAYPTVNPRLPESAEIMRSTVMFLRRAGLHVKE